MQTHTALISVFCPDRTGLVADITGFLFDSGGNLGDSTFAVLGSGAEFTSVCELPADISFDHIESGLRSLPDMADADIKVAAFELDPFHGPSGQITHRITVGGGDRPGLITRLCEVFVQFRANVVRLNADRTPGPDRHNYVIRISAWIPEDTATTCLATVANTAGELGLTCHWEAV